MGPPTAGGAGAFGGGRRARSVALSRCGGRFGAPANQGPHQGGPPGEGRSSRAGCGARGTATTTTRPPGNHRKGSPRESRPTRCRTGSTVCTSPLAGRPADPRTVADTLVETLLAWGDTAFFGMVGHFNLGVAEALRRAEERGQSRFVGIRHEGASAIAARAYGRLTGRPGACVAIAGPGSTNLLTAGSSTVPCWAGSRPRPSGPACAGTAMSTTSLSSRSRRSPQTTSRLEKNNVTAMTILVADRQA
jgi:Thiamine pyrophosphate enzyme, N-terminal TPP binding domain